LSVYRVSVDGDEGNVARSFATCERHVSERTQGVGTGQSGGRWKRSDVEIDVRLTDQTLSCAARAHVPKPTRRTACTHVSRAMQAARRRPDFWLHEAARPPDRSRAAPASTAS